MNMSDTDDQEPDEFDEYWDDEDYDEDEDEDDPGQDGAM
jgi:hypothetical protein